MKRDTWVMSTQRGMEERDSDGGRDKRGINEKGREECERER